LFGAPQLPRHSARPASSTPLADQLNRGWPGVDAGYVVLPRSIAESMSLPWQQQMAALLDQFHQEHARLAWPIYRVVPSRYEKLIDLDEEQLAEAGYLVEIDTDGEIVYRERSGRKVEDAEDTTVLVPCLDPIPKPARRPAPPPAQAPPAARPGAAQESPRAPAPMNIGPAPVWRTTPPPMQSQPVPPPPPVPVAPTVSPPPPAPPAQGRPPAAPPPQAAHHPPAEPKIFDPTAFAPPRGIPMPPARPHQGWSDEPAGQAESEKTEKPDEGGEFGPTGDPTEIPYRYRP
jgi:hypothetical protein